MTQQKKGPAHARAIVAFLASVLLTAASATSQSAGGPTGRQPTGYSITKIRFYPEPPSGSDKRNHRTTFYRGEATFINTEISFKNHYYRRRSQNLGLMVRYQRVGGKAMGAFKINTHVPSSWKSGWAARGRGWRLPGNWPVGTYRVEVSHEGRLVAEGRFSVAADAKSRLFDAGRKKYDKGDYDGAISEFSSLIRRDHSYVRAYVERSRAKKRKKDYHGAISDLDEALRRDPKYVYALGERAYNRVQLKQYREAIGDLNEAIRQDPKYEYGFQLRGTAREKNGEQIGAISDYKQTLRLNPRNFTAFHGLIELRKKRKELDAGISDCTWLIQLDPRYHYFFKRRGDLHRDLKNEDQALADYRKTLTLKPSNRWALSSIVRIHEKRKDLKEAIAECDWLLRLDPNNKAAYQQRSRLRLKQKDYDGALADFDHLIGMDPKNAYNYVSRARAKAAKNDLDGAIADCTRALELKPDHYTGYSRRASYYAKKGRNEEAIQDYRKAIELGRYGRASTLGTILRLRKKMGDTDGAKADLDWAISLDPKKAWPYQARATWKQNRGDHRGAEQDCTQAIELDPKNGPYLIRAKLRLLLKDVNGAMADCDSYVSSKPSKYRLVSTAAVRYRAGRIEEAINDCDRAIKMDPKYTHAYAMRSGILRDTGDYARALADIEKSIQLEAWTYMYSHRARLHLLMGNHDAAFADLGKVIEKSKGKGWAYGQRAEAHYEVGEKADALRDFQRACELAPKSGLGNHLMLFLVRCEHGEEDEAARELRPKLETWKTLDKAEMYFAAGQHLLGDLDAKTLLEKAKEQPLNRVEAWQRAAHYFIGMRHRLDGRNMDAVRNLRLSSEGKHLDEMCWRFGQVNVRRLLLGVTVKPLSKEIASFLGLSGGAGLTITSTWEESPATVAGIRKGDVLVRLNGVPCTQKGIDNLIQKGNVGDKVRLEYVRQGAKQSIDLLLGQSKPAMTAAPPADAK